MIGRPVNLVVSRQRQMSIWVRTFLPKPLGPLDPNVCRSGITQRLALLTYLFCPDEEEEPEDVLDRLRIEAENSDNLRIYFRAEADRFVPVKRYSGDSADEEVKEALEDIARYPDAGADRVREVLSRTVETVGFELKYSDVEGMGVPVTVAAAAKLAELVGGVISADDYGWMVPSGNEVEILVEA